MQGFAIPAFCKHMHQGKLMNIQISQNTRAIAGVSRDTVIFRILYACWSITASFTITTGVI